MDARTPDEKKKTTLIVMDEASPVAEGIYGRAPDLGLKPEEMWPDGKVRPHKVKTDAGDVVHLTDEEFDRLVLAARHRARANKQGPSSAPRPKVKAGEMVTPILPDQVDGWPDFIVRKVKTDGRVIIETLHDDLGELARAKAVKIGEQDFLVLRASGRTVTLRLLREGEVVEGPWLRPEPRGPEWATTVRISNISIDDLIKEHDANVAAAAAKRQAKEDRKARRQQAIDAQRARNREKNAAEKLAATRRRDAEHDAAIAEDRKRTQAKASEIMRGQVLASAEKVRRPGTIGALIRS
jgi:hypothetical protein